MPDLSLTASVRDFYERKPEAFERFRRINHYYYGQLRALLRFLIPEGRSVLDLGCGLGDLLADLEPSRGVGVDLSGKLIERARARHPDLRFETADIQERAVDGVFDYVMMVNTVGDLEDLWKAFRALRRNCAPETRLVIVHYNHLHEPLLKLGEKLGLRMPQPNLNWLNFTDLENLLALNGFETVKMGYRCVLPYYVPLLSSLLNGLVASLPFLHRLGLISYLVAKPKAEPLRPVVEHTVSVLVPVRNERENIEDAVRRTPNLGRHTEIIFVDGNSTDGTRERILEVIERYRGVKEVRLIDQGAGVGKGDAVRKGFAAANGEVLMILDGDLTVPPEELDKFYRAIEEGRGEFINGCRLVYRMEDEAMRFLNLLGNKFFAMAFSWILGQRLKDTLCGTKVLKKSDYLEIIRNRAFFGDFDPFGDFDLIFGAAKNNLKIVEIPIRYRSRTYGETKISRFRHGWLLLRMCLFAFRKFKL